MYSQRLKIEIAATLEQIEKSQIEVDLALQQYIEAAKDHRALELLREKKLKDHLELIDKLETKIIDEQTVQRSGIVAQDNVLQEGESYEQKQEG